MIVTTDNSNREQSRGRDVFDAVRNELSTRLRRQAAERGELLLEGRWVPRETFEREMTRARRRSLLVIAELLALAIIGLYVGGLVLGLQSLFMGPL